MSGGGGDNGLGDNKAGFFDALETLIENLRKECYSKFADREEFNDLKKRIEVIE